MAKKPADYEDYKAKQAEISRDRSIAGRDIAENYPGVVDQARKDSCRTSLRLFCETYLFEQFSLAWSDDHLTAIARLETSGLHGGQFAFAMPRGTGKTTLCEAASLWEALYGHRRFVVIIGATETHAEEFLDSIRTELETNDLLLEDFPEVCYPIRCLEGIAHRCNGQTFNGERTRMSWLAKEMVFPVIPGSPCAGTIIKVAGITGRIRGMKHKRWDGVSVRPDRVIVDDPQTDDSAVSVSQNNTREKILTGAVLGLAGPKVKIAAAMPCTVIAPGDMADRILDRDRNPQWHGERMKLVYAFPTAESLWDEYAQIRRESMRNGGNGSEATDFYALRRPEMDAGARVGWAERFNQDEISAIQYAMNLKIDKPFAFAAEYQNEPIPTEVSSDLPELKADELSKRLNGLARLTVPHECNRLTAFIDVGSRVHWYAVIAWDQSFGGSIIDYGPWPRQNRTYFAADDARPNLETVHPNMAEEARIYAGLVSLTSQILSRSYEREGGGELRVERCGVDAGWLPETIAEFCRQSVHAAVLLPTKGYSGGENRAPIHKWKRNPGQLPGWNWVITPDAGKRKGRLCTFDANHWKSFLVDRFITPFGTPGALRFYGKEKESYLHQLVADHLTCEWRERKQSKFGPTDIWAIKPQRKDNHLWDAVVGAAVAASVQGLEWQAGALAGQVATATPAAKRDRNAPRRHITPGSKHISRGLA